MARYIDESDHFYIYRGHIYSTLDEAEIARDNDALGFSDAYSSKITDENGKVY